MTETKQGRNMERDRGVNKGWRDKGRKIIYLVGGLFYKLFILF
jgi:hypothetical protein